MILGEFYNHRLVGGTKKYIVIISKVGAYLGYIDIDQCLFVFNDLHKSAIPVPETKLNRTGPDRTGLAGRCQYQRLTIQVLAFAATGQKDANNGA